MNATSAGPGQGSEFVVRLPTVRMPCEPASSPVLPAAFTRRRILVIDDNQDAAESLASLLKIWGHEVRVLFDGRKPLKRRGPFLPI